MKIYYEVSWGEIKVRKAIKETEHTITIEERWGWDESGKTRPRKMNKESCGVKLFPTWEEAHHYLLAKLQGQLESCLDDAKRLTTAIAEAKALTKPEDS